MQRYLVHAIQRDIDKARHPPLDHHGAAHQVAHQAAHGTEAAHGNQRAVIHIDIGLELLALHHGNDVGARPISHLVRRLSPGWYQLALVAHRAGGTVANHEDMIVQRGLQRGFDHQLVGTIGLEAADLLHEVRRLDPRSPDHHVSFNQLAILGLEPFGSCLADEGRGTHIHPQLGELLMGGG